MRKQQLIIPFLLVLVFSIMSSPATVFSQESGIKDATNEEIICGEGTRQVGNTCEAICMDGTVLIDGDRCMAPVPLLGGSDNDWIGWGVLLAGIIAGIGIGISIYQQKKESHKRMQELLKTYSDEFREITDKESDLDTKQACSLYVEQYLDTLEQIATLKVQKIFKEKALDYFNNNFAYGIDLWWWHIKYIDGIHDETMQDRLWKVSNNTETAGTPLDIIYPKKIDPNSSFNEPKYLPLTNDDGKEFTKVEIEAMKKALDHSSTLEDLYSEEELLAMKPADKLALRKALLSFLKDDRWPEFRKVCDSQFFTQFDNDYTAFKGKSKDDWRVLPDSLYYDYEEIPDENGLSKAELVEIIRPFANDLSKYVEKEKDMQTPEEFEVYAEQYLETLEQIATLYKNKIIPDKAKEYFENKFSYGCNLWDWYHQRTLKFSKDLCEAFWRTDAPKTKLEDIYSKEDRAVMNDDEKKEAEKKFATVKDDTYEKFLGHYSKVNENETKINPIDKFIREDSDVWKLVRLAAKSAIEKHKEDPKNVPKLFDAATVDVISNFIESTEEYLEPYKTSVYNIGEELVNLRKTKGSNYQITKATKRLAKAEEELAKAIKDMPKTNMENSSINLLVKEFVYSFMLDERWKDFRGWCKDEGITHFQEDSSEGLILPLKMWQAPYK